MVRAYSSRFKAPTNNLPRRISLCLDERMNGRDKNGEIQWLAAVETDLENHCWKNLLVKLIDGIMKISLVEWEI